VSDGTHRVHMAERECSTVRSTNSYSRSNEDSLTAASCLEPQRTRREINTRDQGERVRCQRGDRSHQNLPEGRRCRKSLHALHCCLSFRLRPGGPGLRYTLFFAGMRHCGEHSVNGGCHNAVAVDRPSEATRAISKRRRRATKGVTRQNQEIMHHAESRGPKVGVLGIFLTCSHVTLASVGSPVFWARRA
jgi:hypothetical protein